MTATRTQETPGSPDRNLFYSRTSISLNYVPTLSFARENIKYCREFLGKIKRSPVDFNFRVELSVTLSFNPSSQPASQGRL